MCSRTVSVAGISAVCNIVPIRTFAARGKTIIFTTHYLAEADAFAERIALISRGSIVADGSPAAIKASAGKAELEGAYLALTKSFALEAVS